MGDKDDLINAAKKIKALSFKMADVASRIHSEVLKKEEEIQTRKVELLKERERLIERRNKWFDLDEIEFKKRYSDQEKFFKIYLISEVERLQYENDCLKLELDLYKNELEKNNIDYCIENQLTSCFQFKGFLKEAQIKHQEEQIENNKKGPREREKERLRKGSLVKAIYDEIMLEKQPIEEARRKAARIAVERKILTRVPSDKTLGRWLRDKEE
jgi:hypothetical protein